MNQSKNELSLISVDDENESPNNNCMSTIKTSIEYSAPNFPLNMKLFELSPTDGFKYRMKGYEKRRASLEEIQAIYFDKTIFSHLKKQKMSNDDYFYLFYSFFVKENYRINVFKLGHKNFGKFFKKFFGACVKSKILNAYIIGGFIDFYQFNLYQLLTNSNDSDISNLTQKEIIDLKSLDCVDTKYMHFLVKYILGLANIMEYTKEYINYQKIIFESFVSINDKIFKQYFMKQINKMLLHKSIYIYGNKFIQEIFLSVIIKEGKKSLFDFNVFGSYLLNNILFNDSQYKSNNKKKNEKNNSKSVSYFLNLNNIINIMDDNLKDLNLIQTMLMKLTNLFNSKINLFVDDENKLRIAESLLNDTLNGKLIKKCLDVFDIIKPYLRLDENNNNNVIFFDYIFYDLCMDKYIIYYYNNPFAQKNEANKNIDQETSFSLSSQENNNSFNNNNSSISEKDIMNKIIEKFNNSDNYFINKYFNRNNNINNAAISIDTLSNLNIEELFILLDILYKISIKFPEDQIKDCLSDIHKVIQCIIVKSSNENKFNSCIYNFIISVDLKYIPPPSEFDVFKSMDILLKKSFERFIISYPLFIIFIMNYIPRKNLDIKQFLNILQGFLNGYKTSVFNSIDENANTIYNFTLQINYLSIVYVIISEILRSLNKRDDNDNFDFSYNNDICKYLPYCIYCKKKIKKPLILAEYLCQCTYCGESMLYLNTNLKDYLNDINNKNEIKEFVDNYIYDIITGLTCNILSKFIEKYEKRNTYSMFRYPLYYKIMKEHFKFLNNVKIIIGKSIPFVIDKNNNINNKEGSLEEYMNYFFEKFICEKTKYPFRTIYNAIIKDNFTIFNLYRKTIKHESELAFYKYDK